MSVDWSGIRWEIERLNSALVDAERGLVARMNTLLDLTDHRLVRVAVALAWLGFWGLLVIAEDASLSVAEWPIAARVGLWILPQLLLGFLAGRAWTVLCPVAIGVLDAVVSTAECSDPGSDCTSPAVTALLIAFYVAVGMALTAAGYRLRTVAERRS